MSKPIRSLEDAAGYLEGLINMERRPELSYARYGLGPIRRLLERLGHPQRGLSVVHVAGSKGKGSTALLVESILRATGERVGTFTSPHLERWTERFRLDGEEVAPAQLARAVEALRPHVDSLRAASPRDAPTFFDATTAAGLWLFQRAGVDRVVLEVGLGGRLDSTNVVTPAVTCITGIELEHTDKLGPTLAAIAREKAGILKPGVPLVTGALPDAAEAVVRARAGELGVAWSRLGRELQVDVLHEDLGGFALRVVDGDFGVEARLPILGSHQAANAALAVACVRRLACAPDARLAAAVRRGLATARLPGRTEVLHREPWVVVDCAHTEVSARALARALARLPRRRAHLVLSVSADKDLAGVLRALVPLAQQVTVTRAEPVRSLDPRALASAIRATTPQRDLRVVPNPHLALRAARAGSTREDLLVATGSVYLAGIARRVLGERSARLPVVVSRRAGRARGVPGASPGVGPEGA